MSLWDLGVHLPESAISEKLQNTQETSIPMSTDGIVFENEGLQ